MPAAELALLWSTLAAAAPVRDERTMLSRRVGITASGRLPTRPRARSVAPRRSARSRLGAFVQHSYLATRAYYIGDAPPRSVDLRTVGGVRVTAAGPCHLEPGDHGLVGVGGSDGGASRAAALRSGSAVTDLAVTGEDAPLEPDGDATWTLGASTRGAAVVAGSLNLSGMMLMRNGQCCGSESDWRGGRPSRTWWADGRG